MNEKQVNIPIEVQEAVLEAFNSAGYNEVDEYDGVEYLGMWKGYYVFIPNYIGDEACIGFGPFYLVKGSKVETVLEGLDERFDDLLRYYFG